MAAQHILTYAKDLRGGGGVERAQLRLVAGWLAAGRRVTLVLGRAGGPLAQALPVGLEVVTLGPADARGGVLPLRALADVVRERAPDLVFCAGNTYTSAAAWLRLRLGAATPPLVGKMSNSVRRTDMGPLVRAGHRAWLALHGRFLDHLVAMTPDTAAQADPALGMAGRVSVIPNPPVEPAPGATPADLPPGLPAGRFVLGVGRLVAQKRWDRLIAAMPALADETVPLVIVGEGERRAALEAQVTALGLGDRVFLPGHSADPLPIMARAGVVVLPSQFEGVPGVLREALSVGTPVVATESSPAIGEIVTSSALGTVVAAADEEALVAALATALDRWLDPGAVRPAPVAQPGHDAPARYLALFDRLVAERAVSAPLPSPAGSRPAAPTGAPARP